jgi:hypothetical protein
MPDEALNVSSPASFGFFGSIFDLNHLRIIVVNPLRLIYLKHHSFTDIRIETAVLYIF